MKSSPSLRSPTTQCKRPVWKLSAPEIHTLRLVPGVRRGLCLPLRIQQKPTLGLVSSLVSSWKNDPASSVICRTSSSLACFSMICSSESFSGGTRRGLLQRKPRRCSARRTVSRLRQRSLSLSLRSCTASSLQLQRERSQPCSMGESSSSSFSTRSFASCPSNGLGPRGGRRASIGGEQRDVHPEPAAGLRFALHLDDEVFAYLRCDGDILHVRPFLWWLDGCGVFTMPQRTAACSIILCFYLVFVFS